MLETIKKRINLCGLICVVTALVMLVFQFVPFWDYDTSYRTNGEAVAIETRGGQWEHIVRTTLNERTSAEKIAREASGNIEKAMEEAVSAAKAAVDSGDAEDRQKATEAAAKAGEVASEYLDMATQAGVSYDAQVKAYVDETVAVAEKAQKLSETSIEEIATTVVSTPNEVVSVPIEKKSFSPYGYTWLNFRDTEFLEYLSFNSGEVVNFSDVLTPHATILLTAIFVLIINLIKRDSLIGAFVATICGVCGVCGMFFSSAYMLGTAWMWFIQIAASIVLCFTGMFKFYLIVRAKERQAVEEELA